jgi:hypothetical protein
MLAAIASAVSMVGAEPATSIEGLWKYEAIAPGGGAEVPIDGFIVFRAGRFVQQTLNVGEPFREQVAQAHAGTYRIEDDRLQLLAEVGFVVTPLKPSPVDARHGSTHQLTVRRSGKSLTLTFGTGTVQKLTSAGPGNGHIYPLTDGALALVDGRFVLVGRSDGRAVAGSGTFARANGNLRMEPLRWFSIRDGRPEYSRARVVATFDGTTLKIPGEPALPVKK